MGEMTKPLRQGVSSQPKECYLLKMPEEILLDIFDSAYKDHEWLSSEDKCKVLLACKRLHRTSVSNVYRRIQIAGPEGYSGEKESSMSRLARTVKEDPILAQYCRHLEILYTRTRILEDRGETPFLRCLKEFSKLKALAIEGEVSNLKSVLTAVKNSPIEDLRIRDVRRASVPMIFQQLASQSSGLSKTVKHLSLRNDLKRIHYRWLFVHRTTATDELDSWSKFYRGSSVTSLELLDFDSTDATAILAAPLSVFRGLQHLTLDPVPCSDNDLEHLAHTLEFLQKHRETLKSLTFTTETSSFTPWEIETFDFPALEALHITGHTVIWSHGGFEALVNLLVASQLRVLTLEFHLGDLYTTSAADFWETDMQWIYEFASDSRVRQSSLEEIRVTFNTRFFFLPCQGPPNYDAWRMLARARKVIPGSGIKFVGDMPPCVDPDVSWSSSSASASAADEPWVEGRFTFAQLARQRGGFQHRRSLIQRF